MSSLAQIYYNRPMPAGPIFDLLISRSIRGFSAVSAIPSSLRRWHLILLFFGMTLISFATWMTLNEEIANTSHLEITEAPNEIEKIEKTALNEIDSSVAEKPDPWRTFKVRDGDNLSIIFAKAGFSDRDLYEVVKTSADGKKLSKLYPNHTLSFQSDVNGDLIGVKHRRSLLESTNYWRAGDSFKSKEIILTPQKRITWTSARIESSLFLAGQSAGLTHNSIMELANIFGGVIDFFLDPRKGDTIHLVYEQLFLNEEKIDDGDIIAAAFYNRGKEYTAFKYTNSAGDVGYYNAKGVSMRKAFLLAPLDFTRISSNFNPRRLHPIYKTTRPHRGTDYAAPRGTPVFASGDGRVIESSYTKANGKYIVIRHGEQYVTKYLHLNRRKVRRGQKVKQSQVIGTVGSTGAATGPHLHYEFLMNGVHRNPRTIHKKLPKAKSLPRQEIQDFQRGIFSAKRQLLTLKEELLLIAKNETGTVAH